MSEQRLQAEARRERLRISDALHDDVLPWAASARQDLVELSANDDMDPLVISALEAVTQTITAIRSVLAANHDVRLESSDLGTALERIAQDAASRGQLRLQHELSRVAALQPHARLVLESVRELCANAVRHADADTLTLRVGASPAAVSFEVEDDGHGAVDGGLTSDPAVHHFGLARMRDHVEACGGELTISTSAAGTTVRVDLPVASDAQIEPVERTLEAFAALNETGAAWTVVRSDGTYAFISEKAAELVGYSPLEIESYGPEWTPWQTEPGKFVGQLSAAAAMGQATFETTIVHRDGRRLDVTCTVKPIVRSDGYAFLTVTRLV